MRVGIDATGLRRGGGVTHLREILRATTELPDGIERVTVWSGGQTLETLPRGRDWLDLIHVPALDGRLPRRMYWQNVQLTPHARASCDILFNPGGSYAGAFRPFVTMCRNMLPFEANERARFGASVMRLKLHALHLAQARTFRRADGVIFLNDYARRIVSKELGAAPPLITTIPHGVSNEFRRPPRPQRPLSDYTFDAPFRLLYVSIIDVYKHQWHVARAVAELRTSGFPIVIEFHGPSYRPALRRFEAVRAQLDPSGEFLLYKGATKYNELAAAYHAADAFVFASSCENMPNILVEAMAAGLPIACSARGPMPEILGDAGVYFDPESGTDIRRALEQLLPDDRVRAAHAAASFRRASEFSWKACADATWTFLKHVSASAAAHGR